MWIAPVGELLLVVFPSDRSLLQPVKVRRIRSFTVPGSRVRCVRSRGSPHPLLPPSPQERISFLPHPKTMTMAGDYEYFASQGKHPLVYALAELVDNALRAMRLAGEPRDPGTHR